MTDPKPPLRATGEAAVARKLTAASVMASSPKGVVKVVYNGHAEAVEMTLKPQAIQQYDSQNLGDLTAKAFQAADRAVMALRQHAFGVTGQTPPASAAETVTACFGRQD